MRWPLSGDVSQWINPSWWMGSFGQQLGFININETSSADPGVERRIVEEVASYGRQLGWISEALEVVMGCVRNAGLTDNLTGAEQVALDRLKRLVEDVHRVKTATAPRPLGRSDQLEARIATLEDEVRDLTALLRGQPVLTPRP
jgi:aminoglycoside phosphotransferase (APT) family kinase protein